MNFLHKLSLIIFKPEKELKLLSKSILGIIIAIVIFLHIFIAEFRLSQNELSNTILKISTVLIITPLIIFIGLIIITKIESKKS